MGPPPVLCEDDGQGLVKCIIYCYRKGLPQKKLGVQLSVKQFVILNWKKRILKITCLEIDGFQHSLAAILCCPLALVGMRTHPLPHWVSQILEIGKHAICYCVSFR